MKKNTVIATGLFAFAILWFMLNLASLTAIPKNIAFLYGGASNGGHCTIPANNCPVAFVEAIEQGFVSQIVSLVIGIIPVGMGAWFLKKKSHGAKANLARA